MDANLNGHYGLDHQAIQVGFTQVNVFCYKFPKVCIVFCFPPYRSPTHAGGLFAMDRKYFFEMGAYDDGLQIWGGENFELSFKVS